MTVANVDHWRIANFLCFLIPSQLLYFTTFALVLKLNKVIGVEKQTVLRTNQMHSSSPHSSGFGLTAEELSWKRRAESGVRVSNSN